MEVGRRKRGGGKGVRSKEWFDNLIVCLFFHPAWREREQEKKGNREKER